MILRPAQIRLMALGQPVVPANGSGGGGPTSSTTNTSNLPEYAQPYFEDLLSQTQGVAGQGYVGYNGARVQGQTPAQLEAANRIGSATNPQQMDAASNMTGAAAQGMAGTANYYAPDINASYNPNQSQMYNAPNQVQSQYQPGQFTGATVGQYMNPYTQYVTDNAKQESNNQFQQQNVARDAQAAQQGAFGGDRAALVKQEAQRGQNINLNAIQNQGDQAAYNAATQQFNAAQGQQQTANQQGLGAQTTNAQNQMAYGAAGNQNQQFNIGQQYNRAQLGLQGQTANAAAQAQAAGIQQAGYNGLGALGSQMSNIGQADQNLYLQRASALNQIGTQQQQTGQQSLDAAYQNFVNQRDYPKSNLNFYSGILHGVPVTPNSDVQTTTAAPSMTSQLAGLGIAGAGLYNATK